MALAVLWLHDHVWAPCVGQNVCATPGLLNQVSSIATSIPNQYEHLLRLNAWNIILVTVDKT